MLHLGGGHDVHGSSGLFRYFTPPGTLSHILGEDQCKVFFTIGTVSAEPSICAVHETTLRGFFSPWMLLLASVADMVPATPALPILPFEPLTWLEPKWLRTLAT
mmetsp:Transcript_2220/g.1766  ORF Transcript_2220/g.1766 Transcript_2220/m.1766 type:complete len:104 (+) Transcript_2220:92-403(+)